MVQINWTYKAKDDLKSIVDYITKDSKRYARLQAERIKMRTHSLKTQPRIGKIVQEINNLILESLFSGITE
jgi:plasmid stabilization system protein ParE